MRAPSRRPRWDQGAARLFGAAHPELTVVCLRVGSLGPFGSLALPTIATMYALPCPPGSWILTPSSSEASIERAPRHRTSFGEIRDQMSYLTLKILHLVGLALTFMGLAGALASNGATTDPAARRVFSMSHGFGLVLVPITGFFMLVQLGIGKNLPGWVWGKVIVWLLAGASLMLVRRFSKFKGALLLYLAALVALGAWLALYKPF
jgi:hypothetical protein